MKDILRKAALPLAILLVLVTYVSSGITALSNEGISVTKVTSTVEGISITNLSTGDLICDSLVCPPETASCRVTKLFDPSDASYFLRNRRCIDSNGSVTEQQKIREPIGRFNRTITVEGKAGINGEIIMSDVNPDEDNK